MKLKTIVISLLLGSSIGLAHAEAPDWKAYMTDDWDGRRASLYEKGVQINASHISDVMRNFKGGTERKNAWMGQNALELSLDFDKMLGWSGTSAYVKYHQHSGTKFNADYVQSFNGVSNIEVPVSTHKLFQAWLQKEFTNTFSVLAGVYAIDSEFFVTPSSGVFLQPPYGISNDIGQTGSAAIFPTGALGVRAKYKNDSGLYLQAAVVDGVPGDPKDPYGTHIHLKDGEGHFDIAEVGLNSSNSKAAVGAWRYSRDFSNFKGEDDKNYGLYGLIEGKIAPEPKNPEQGVSGFFRLGAANGDVNPADWTSSVGLAYTGLYQGRDKDVAGVALTVNHASDLTKNAMGKDSATEYAYEMSYQAEVTPWFNLKPTVQYIHNPGMSDSARNVWVGGVRGTVNF